MCRINISLQDLFEFNENYFSQFYHWCYSCVNFGILIILPEVSKFIIGWFKIFNLY